jgi:amino acid adenylation domain-containing protein
MIEQTQHLPLAARESDWNYWQQKLSGNLPVIDLPIDRSRPPIASKNYTSYCFQLESEIYGKLQQLMRVEDVSLYMTLLAVFQVLLYRYTAQEDIVIISPSLETSTLVSHVNNPVILRTNLSNTPSFKNFLTQIRQTVLESLAHQDYLFPLLIEKLLPNQNIVDSPLFKIWFACNSSERSESCIRYQEKLGFDLSLEIIDRAESCWCSFKYNSDLFNAATIERMAGHWQTLIAEISTTPEREISQLCLLTKAEKHQLLVECNDTEAEYPKTKCIHQLFEWQALQTPDAIAVIFEDKQLTYRELNLQATKLASYLQSVGVKPDTLIGIYVERSLEMIVGILAILKAGGAYVPLDPTAPVDRLGYILEDTKIKVLLTQSSLNSALDLSNKSIHIVDLDRIESIIDSHDTDLELIVTPHNLAYVIYTSGSTGKPKGVQIEHHTAINLFTAMADGKPGICDRDTLLSVTTICFDMSVPDLFLPLIVGARLVVVSHQVAADGQKLSQAIDLYDATFMQATPVSWQLLLASGWQGKPNLKIIIGGEALSLELAGRLIPKCGELWNFYGPTEATVWSSADLVRSLDCPISLGKPLNNVEYYILDAHLQPLPIGLIGELHIGGVGLARGYFNRPELTQEKFISIPPAPLTKGGAEGGGIGNRLYKTGDLARYLPDGKIEYLGRIDNQVKIRGFRIELGEIEYNLNIHPDIDRCVVIAREDIPGDKRLVAYLITDRDLRLSTEELKNYLGQKLPDYMIPSHFVFLDDFPLTPNAKIDRRALPAPDIRQAIEQSYEAPSTDNEKSIADIWKTVLRLEKVGLRDNFFELGGNSLLAMQIVSQMRQALGFNVPLNSLFESPTIAELSNLIEINTEKLLFIESISRNGKLLLSSPERSLWFFDRLHPQSCVYNIPLTFQLTGSLDIQILEKSFYQIIKRHEILRTAFVEVDGQPSKVIAEDLNFELLVVDLTDVTENEKKTKADRLAEAEARQPFDLESESLIRAKLLCLQADKFWLLITFHHIIFDGWSIDLLFNELTTTYESLSRNSPSPLLDVAIQYVDYAHWQQQWLQSEEYSQQIDYWRQQLANIPPLIELPSDRPRPSIQSYRGDRYTLNLSENLSKALKVFSRQEGVTLFMTLLTAFKTLLYRYSDRTDIIVGSPFANRNLRDTENSIGFFVNTLVLRTQIDANLSFRELLNLVRQVVSGASAHGNLPFEKLVEELQPERDLSYNPLFQVMFAFQERLNTNKCETGLTWNYLGESNRHSSMFDLTLDLEEISTGIKGHLEYNSDLFDRDTIARMAGHFQILLEAIVTNCQEPIATLQLLTPAEKQQILIDWNNTQIDYPHDKCIHQLFEEQVERTPDAIAVVFEGQQLTYSELNSRANRLAHYLQTLAVKPEVLVGICVDRSLEMVVGLLGILKAGGAYVPLDPAYPQERLAYMLEDSQVSVLLTKEKLVAQLLSHQAQIICLDREEEIDRYSIDNPQSTIEPNNLAYLIYTSGSTGKPKGVLLAHRGLVNLAQAQGKAFQILPNSRVLQFASLCFDASISEIVMTLIFGASLYLASPEDLLPGNNLTRLLDRSAITHVTLPPSALSVMQPEEVTKLKVLIVAGEACSGELVAKWSKNRLFFNAYGPTESTVCATVHLCQTSSQSPPIGKAIDNTQLYILDERLQPVPIGIPGELHIAGVGLARGYLNRPDLTASKFIAAPFSARENRLYKTGDLARYLPNGTIEYLGRIDRQVKIRGFRIELGEVESLLIQHPQIREAVVIAREDIPGDKRLVAYLCFRRESTEIGELRSYLQENLPNYMIPSNFVFLEAMPLTSNGKIDHRALPKPDISRLVELIEPQNDVERQLLAIWQEVLNIDSLGIRDNFFELGGHSLLAVKLFKAIESEFGQNLPLAILFEAPTIEQLARLLQTPNKTKSFASLVLLKRGNSRKTPLFLIHDVDGETILYLNLARHLDSEQPVYGIRPYSQTGYPILHTRISEMVEHYLQEIRKIQPQGPYLIGGLCAGGVLAVEIACQLQALGEEVPLVAIIDAINPDERGKSDLATENRRHNFVRAFGQKQPITEVAGILIKKITNLIVYEINTKTQNLADKFRIKLLRYYLDRQLNLPQFCQNIAVRTVYKFAESEYQPSVYRGKLTLWRATEKLDISNPLIDDTPAKFEVKDPFFGWKKQATDGVVAFDIPGGHSSMLQEPNVEIMAEKMQFYIDLSNIKY